MKDLISRIISDEEISVEDKCILIEKLIKATHDIDRFVAPGRYLHTEIDYSTGDFDIQLWYRMEEDSGMRYHGPTNQSNDVIIELMKERCLRQNRNFKK